MPYVRTKEIPQKKREQVELIRDKLERSSLVIATDFTGLTVKDLTLLRRKLKEVGAEYKVVKNTLANIAAQRAGKTNLGAFLRGPTGLVFGYDDVIAAAKVLIDFQRSGEASATIVIKGGLLDNRILSPKEIEDLLTLPPRDELMRKLVGLLGAPIFNLIGHLNAPLYMLVGSLRACLLKLIWVLQARIKQLEGGKQDVAR